MPATLPLLLYLQRLSHHSPLPRPVPRPQLLLSLAGTNAAWNVARLRTALERAGRDHVITVAHGWKRST